MAERSNKDREREKKEYTRMPVARSLRSYHARGFDDLLTTTSDKEKANELRERAMSESVHCGNK